MPQFWLEDFAPQLIWLSIAFLVLYFLMRQIALPRIAEVLEARQERIEDDLDEAARLKEQAEKALADYEAGLATARGEAQAILAEANRAFNDQAERRNTEIGERLNREANEAAARITAAKSQAMGEVRGIAADVAGQICERLLGAGTAAATTIEGAVEGALRDGK